MREIQQQIDEIQMELQSYERWGFSYLRTMFGDEYVDGIINSINDERKEIIDISNFKFLK